LYFIWFLDDLIDFFLLKQQQKEEEEEAIDKNEKPINNTNYINITKYLNDDSSQ
jgi:hypothetical protein